MGNRRLGAQRLDTLLRRGVQGRDTAYQAGASISPAIVSHRMYNEGAFIITEICLDLGVSTTDIRASDAADEPISTEGATTDAHLMLWENDIHGVPYFAETYIIEAATTVTAMSLRYGDVSAARDAALTNGADLLAGFACNAAALGASALLTGTPDGKYVHLTADNNADTTLNAGQMIIRLVGIKAGDVDLS